MIDRTRAIFVLRRSTMTTALLLSVGLFAALPAIALLIVVAGGLVSGLCWGVLMVLGLGGLGGLLIGSIMFLSGLGSRNDNAVGGGIFTAVAGLIGVLLWQAFHKPMEAAATHAWEHSKELSLFVLQEIFIGLGAFLWSWTPLCVTLLAALAALLLLGALRSEAFLKGTLLRIRYACPKCHERSVPVFRCSHCRGILRDLRPSIFGIVRARCGTCGTSLPTADLAGRLRLEKMCAGCSVDLNAPEFARQAEYHLAIVGATSSGKTTLMAETLHGLCDELGPRRGLTVSFGSAEEERRCRQWTEQLKSGAALEKTVVNDRPPAFHLSLAPRRGRGCSLYLYDAAGEVFEQEERLIGHRFHQFIDGIAFVIDPWAEASIRTGLDVMVTAEQIASANPAPTEAAEIFSRLTSFLERVAGQSTRRAFDIPLAIVVTKTDLAELGRTIRTAHASRSNTDVPTDDSARVREFLVRHGLGNLVSTVESRFRCVSYFTVSAMGQTPGNDVDTAALRRNLAPVQWLGEQTGALDNCAASLRLVRNASQAVSRIFCGHEGKRAQRAAWLLTFCGLALPPAMWTAVLHFPRVSSVPDISATLVKPDASSFVMVIPRQKSITTVRPPISGYSSPSSHATVRPIPVPSRTTTVVSHPSFTSSTPQPWTPTSPRRAPPQIPQIDSQLTSDPSPPPTKPLATRTPTPSHTTNDIYQSNLRYYQKRAQQKAAR